MNVERKNVYGNKYLVLLKMKEGKRKRKEVLKWRERGVEGGNERKNGRKERREEEIDVISINGVTYFVR